MKVQFLVEASHQKGLGHLKRCETLAVLLEKRRAVSVFSSEILPDIDLLIVDRRENPENHRIVEKAVSMGVPTAVWGDRTNKNATATVFWAKPDKVKTANFYGPKTIIVKKPEFKFSSWSGEFKKVLVSMGGSDPFCLTSRIVKALTEISSVEKVLVIMGRFYKCKNINHPKVEYQKEVPSLYPFINNADAVITSYGSTLFETITARRPAFVVFHTKYHEKMFRKLNLDELSFPIGNRFTPVKKIKKRIIEIISNRSAVEEKMNSISYDFTDGTEFVEFLMKLSQVKDKRCTLCGSTRRSATLRTESETIFRCENCQSIYRVSWKNTKKNGNDRQFLEDAKNRYGKTYEEMEKEIEKESEKRLKEITRFTSGGKLLDVGCATGVFLSTARRFGFEVLGIEPSRWAWKKAETRGVDVFNGKFEEFSSDEKFDVITAWFVMEHTNIDRFMSKVKELLKDGGIFALSVPRGDGATAKLKPEFYASIIPEDHEFEPSLKGLKRKLEKEGFKVVKIKHSGFHPERTFGTSNRTLNGILKLLMKALKLGDTFEVYSVKT